jgi:hypothetical protein
MTKQNKNETGGWQPGSSVIIEGGNLSPVLVCAILSSKLKQDSDCHPQ